MYNYHLQAYLLKQSVAFQRWRGGGVLPGARHGRDEERRGPPAASKQKTIRVFSIICVILELLVEQFLNKSDSGSDSNVYVWMRW